MKKIILGLGSDLGNRMENLSDSGKMIGETIGRIISTSSVYETEPWGFESNSYFLNQVLEVETDHNPSGLLGRILMIESELGRLRHNHGYTSRIIDIDILFYESEIMTEGPLCVPHPHLHERRFVLVPLNEIAPDFIHPVLNKTVKELLELCMDKGKVIVYKP